MVYILMVCKYSDRDGQEEPEHGAQIRIVLKNQNHCQWVDGAL